MKLSNGVLLLPTLNRIELLKKFIKSYKETESSVETWILVDQGDFISKQTEYQALELHSQMKIVETNAVTMGGKLRELWEKYKNKDFVMLCNDDHVLKTKGWDKTIVAHLRDHMVIGTNDGETPDKPWTAPNKLGGMTCWAGKVIRTVGYIMPDGLNQLYVDDVWETIGRRCGNLQILMNVCVFHDHAFKGRAKDDTFHRVYPEGWNDPNHANGGETRAYQEWQRVHADKDCQKIMDLQPKQGMQIATPSHDGNVAFGYALGLVDLALFMNQHNVYFEMSRVVGSSLIPHARNSLVDMFMKSKCQKLLFVDSDQIWTKEAAIMLFQSNRRIVAGVTPHKRFPMNLNFDPLPEHKHFFKDHSNKSSAEYAEYAKANMDAKGEVEVAKAGFGFIMVDRSVFELMQPLVSDYRAFDNNDEVIHHEYFAMGAVDGKYYGEDWSFCNLAKKLNIPMFINVNAQVQHRGNFDFTVGM